MPMRLIDTVTATGMLWVRLRIRINFIDPTSGKLRSVMVTNVCTTSIRKALWRSSCKWSLTCGLVGSDESILVSTVLTFPRMHSWASDVYDSITLQLVFRYFSNSPTTKKLLLSCKSWRQIFFMPRFQLVSNFWLITKFLSPCRDWFCCNYLKLWGCCQRQYHFIVLLLQLKITELVLLFVWTDQRGSKGVILRIECHFWRSS